MSFWDKLFGRKEKSKSPSSPPTASAPAMTKPPSTPAAPKASAPIGVQSFTSEQVSRNAAELGEMYFDCPHCGHCERLNDVGKTIYKSNPFQFKEYSCLKCKKKFDAAPRMKFGTCPTSGAAAAGPSPLAAQVKFKKKWSKMDGGTMSTYEEFTGPNEQAAKAFLNTRDVTQSLYYLVVETPEGCWGKDRAGIYKED